MRTSKISIYHDFKNAHSTYYTCRTDTPLHPKFLEIFNAFLSLQMFFFSKSTFRKVISGILSVYNSLDSDQARRSVGPDLGPNCLQKRSSDDTRRHRLKALGS